MTSRAIASVLLLTLAFGAVDQASAAHRDRYRGRTYYSGYSQNRSDVLPAGTPISVRLESKLSTESASQGDRWVGTVDQSVYANDRVMIPAGSRVEGVVTSSAQGTHETRPQIALAVRRVTFNGQTRDVYADTDPIVADTQRARKLGAIAGGAAAGALLGHTVAKDKHGTLIGGILGGAAGYGLTRHAFRTMQLKPGTVVTFTTRDEVVARRY